MWILLLSCNGSLWGWPLHGSLWLSHEERERGFKPDVKITCYITVLYCMIAAGHMKLLHTYPISSSSSVVSTMVSSLSSSEKPLDERLNKSCWILYGWFATCVFPLRNGCSSQDSNYASLSYNNINSLIMLMSVPIFSTLFSPTAIILCMTWYTSQMLLERWLKYLHHHQL